MGLAHTLRFIVDHPLSRGRRFKNISRFARWQVQSRWAGQPPATFTFVNGARMHVRRGMRGVTGSLYVGLEEFDDMALVLHMLRSGDLFVDVGANVGAYTILAAAVTGASVIAFEPGSEARYWLRQNIALNECDARVDVRSQAVGGMCGVASFTTGLDTTNHLIPDGAASQSEPGTESVEITTLDAALNGRRPTMLKVDVEGFEAEVVRGGGATLADPALKCILIELAGAGSQYGFDQDKIHSRMHQLGFDRFQYWPFERMLTRAHTDKPNNALFVRDVAFIQARVGSAPAFRVLDFAI